ncbi:MAG: hypothetical protein U1F43_08715 [Myxococcota bacterium]
MRAEGRPRLDAACSGGSDCNSSWATDEVACSDTSTCDVKCTSGACDLTCSGGAAMTCSDGRVCRKGC